MYNMFKKETISTKTFELLDHVIRTCAVEKRTFDIIFEN